MITGMLIKSTINHAFYNGIFFSFLFLSSAACKFMNKSPNANFQANESILFLLKQVSSLVALAFYKFRSQKIQRPKSLHGQDIKWII